MADLISREAAIDLLRYYPIKNPEPTDVIPAVLETARKFIAKLPDVDAVSRGLFEQIKWERDIAMEQLTEHGIAFGAKSDPASLRPKGEWELTVRSFYRDTFDESCELSVYIVANCSECFGRHPNSYQVFSKTLYAPEDADDGFRFDQKAEEDKALREFRNRNYQFAYFCPNCGADMRGNPHDS